MPEMDGYTAVNKIRTEFQEPKRSIPIMAMTAHATATEKEKCLNALMNDYISKPFEPLELKKKILELTKSTPVTLKNVSNVSTSTVDLNTNQPDNSKSSPGTDGLSPDAANNSQDPGEKINLSYLKRISEGNEAFVIEMIEMFLNKTPVALDQINDCFQKQNWEEMRKIVHRIKPSFAYIGMQDLQKTLGKIETWSNEKGDKNVISKLIKEVETGSRKVFEQLRAELGSRNA
jgi:CheY-like chemotaxis protein